MKTFLSGYAKSRSKMECIRRRLVWNRKRGTAARQHGEINTLAVELSERRSLPVNLSNVPVQFVVASALAFSDSLN